MTDLTKLTLAAALDGLKAKQFSSREITQDFVSAIEGARVLNAYVVETPEKALAMADASDAKLAKGEGGRLEGAPLGIKDLYCTKGVRTTACSGILGEFTPTYESTVTQNLWDEGAVMLGKLNMDEFAMGSSNETSHFGNVINPWRRAGDNQGLTPGGSSGGSAASVAANLCLAATASDTGGSIRQPAAFTGTVGIKPTYGRASVSKGVKGMRIGIPKEYRIDGLSDEMNALWDQGIAWLKDAGAEIVEISLPHTKYALPAYYIVAPAEASSNLARYDGMRYGARIEGNNLTQTYEGTRAGGFGAEVQRRLLIGTYVLSSGYYDAYYLRAQKVRTKILNDFVSAFEGCDAVLTPTCPSPAFAFGEKSGDPVEMYLNDVFTVTANLAGLPGISVPTGMSKSGLPLGLQVIGKALDETACFRVGGELERAAGFVAKPEKWW